MPQEPVTLPNAWNKGGHFVAFWRQTFAVAEADVRKLRHDPVELLTRMTQPALWQSIFGSGVDFAVMLAILALLITIAAKLYPNIIN